MRKPWGRPAKAYERESEVAGTAWGHRVRIAVSFFPDEFSELRDLAARRNIALSALIHEITVKHLASGEHAPRAQDEGV